MKKKLLSLLLAASMLSALCACGSPANSGSASQSAPESKAESAAAPETKAPTPDVAPTEAASAGEASTVEAVEPAVTIQYPIPGEHTFTMVSVLRMNAPRPWATRPIPTPRPTKP